jgi:hypothetical protein
LRVARSKVDRTDWRSIVTIAELFYDFDREVSPRFVSGVGRIECEELKIEHLRPQRSDPKGTGGIAEVKHISSQGSVLSRYAQTVARPLVIDETDAKSALIRSFRDRFGMLHQLLDASVIMITFDPDVPGEGVKEQSRSPPLLISPSFGPVVEKAAVIGQASNPMRLQTREMIRTQASGLRSCRAIKRTGGVEILHLCGLGLASSQ